MKLALPGTFRSVSLPSTLVPARHCASCTSKVTTAHRPSPPREHWASPRPEAVAPAHPRTAPQGTLLIPFSLDTELLSLPQRLPGRQQTLASPSWARWVPNPDNSQQHQLGEAGRLWQEGAPQGPTWGAPCEPSLPHRALLSSCRDSLGSFVTS